MSKHLEILENFDKLSRDALIELVGQILTTAEDVAYGYDITGFVGCAALISFFGYLLFHTYIRNEAGSSFLQIY